MFYSISEIPYFLVAYQQNWFGTVLRRANLPQKSGTMERITLPPTETQIIVAIIVKAIAPCSIFAFGYRNNTNSVSSLLSKQPNIVTGSHHFDLLVFSNKAFQNGASSIANTTAEISNKSITVSVLLHKVTDLATKQPSQQWFFDTVLRHGQRLCLDTAAPPYLLNSMPARDIATDTAYWHKCVAVAQFNLQAAADSEHLDITLCKIALLNTAATQIALGLIRVFLGYMPNEFGLKYLLQLCGHFTDLPMQLYGQQTPEAIKRYKMLCAPPSMLNHWTRLNAAEQDFIWLLDAFRALLRLATELVTPELQRLENTLTKSIPS